MVTSLIVASDGTVYRADLAGREFFGTAQNNLELTTSIQDQGDQSTPTDGPALEEVTPEQQGPGHNADYDVVHDVTLSIRSGFRCGVFRKQITTPR